MDDEKQPDEELLRPRDVARILGWSRWKVHRHARDQKPVGGHVLAYKQTGRNGWRWYYKGPVLAIRAWMDAAALNRAVAP